MLKRPCIQFLISILLLTLLISLKSNAQNLYPYKLSKCVFGSFCLDCGDQKVGFVAKDLDSLLNSIGPDSKLLRMEGEIFFQVLIDSLGRGCVLSHTDKRNYPLTQYIVDKINSYRGWTPAKTEGTKEEMSSINISVRIKNNILMASKKMLEFPDEKKDIALEADKPYSLDKKLTGTSGQYQFVYSFSESQDNNRAISSIVGFDKLNNLWFILGDSLMKHNNTGISGTKLDMSINPLLKKAWGVLIDTVGTKWYVAFKENWKVAILSQSGGHWTDHSNKLPLINYFHDFALSSKSNKIILTFDQGLLIWQAPQWTKISPIDLKLNPEEKFYFGREDRAGILWIGGHAGSYQRTSNNIITNFNLSNNPLNGKTITAITEDEVGNVYIAYQEIYKKGGRR